MDKTVFNLIKKYDVSGPRYTSYPPAPIFTPDFTREDFAEAMFQTENRPGSPDLSLYVHFPFCDTLCYFCGCTTIVTRNREHLAEYLPYLKKEIDLLAPALSPERRVVQMHWGGGTPTYFSPEQIENIGGYIRQAFKFAGDAEVSVEVDPREITRDHLRALRNVGFNRISLGVQDFNPIVQKAVNRTQSEMVTRDAIAWSRELGFESLNVDLIYGLPSQTVESFSETLDKIIEIAPERIAVYNFAYVPWIKKHQTLIHTEDLPSPDTKIGMLTTTIAKLTAAGYVYIGMDHFARPDDELAMAQRTKKLHRNFQGYSTKAGTDMYGLGMSSISHFGTAYAQNEKTLREYYHAVEVGRFATHVGYRMTPDDILRKRVILRLMCDLSLNKREVEDAFGVKFDEYFADAMVKLMPLVDDQLITVSQNDLVVTPQGRLFLRNIAMCFDAYLSDKPKQQPLYSKTV